MNMMMGTSLPQSEESRSSFATFAALLAVVADPAAAKERLDGLVAAAAKASAKIVAAAEATAELDRQRAAQAKALKDERAAHDQELAKQQADFAERSMFDHADATERLRLAKEVESRNAARTAELDVLQANLERRLALLQSAVA